MHLILTDFWLLLRLFLNEINNFNEGKASVVVRLIANFLYACFLSDSGSCLFIYIHMVDVGKQ